MCIIITISHIPNKLGLKKIVSFKKRDHLHGGFLISKSHSLAFPIEETGSKSCMNDITHPDRIGIQVTLR